MPPEQNQVTQPTPSETGSPASPAPTSETPPEQPPAQPAKADEASASEPEINWDFLEPDDGDVVPEGAQPAQEQPPEPQTPLVAPTPAEPQKPAEPPVQEQFAAPQPQEPSPAPAPQPQVQPQPQPVPQPTQTPAQQWDAWKTAAEDNYAKNLFAITEDEGTAILQAPHEQLPKMAARVAVLTQEAIYNNLAAVLPGMIKNVLGQVRGEGQAEKALLEAFPALKGKKDTYDKVMQGVRNMYPEMKAEQLIQVAGQTAYSILGIRPGGGNGQTPPQPQAQPQTPQPVRQTVEPFSPAAPGAGGPPQQKPGGNSNPWADLDAEWAKQEREEW